MVTVDDIAICRALLMLDEHSHLSCEPAGAVPVAAMINGVLKDALPRTGTIAAIVSGGNVDTFQKTRYVRRALAAERRHLSIKLRLTDRRGSTPRQLAEFFHVLAEHEVNILDVAYRRSTLDLPVGVVEVALLLETRGGENAHAVRAALGVAGFQFA